MAQSHDPDGSKMPPFIEHHVPGSQGKVYARDYPGEGPAFVLMHGFPDNSRIYDDLLPHLVAAGRRVVTFDFLGFGRSEKPASAVYTFRQQLDDLRAVVAHLDLGRIVPVAHDASGAAAANFAIEEPDGTAALVIPNAAFAHPAAGRWPELIELFATPSLRALAGAIIQSPEQFGWIVDFQRERFKDALADEHKAHYDAFLGPVIDDNFRRDGAGPVFVQMTSHFFEELARNGARIAKLEALDVPVRIVWGENDPYLDAGVARDWHAHLKRASLSFLPAGHWLKLDEPALVAGAMLS